jgi:hypothetical protein
MEQKIVHEFSRLRVLSTGPISVPPSPNKKKVKLNKKMDALVHDLNTALELDEPVATGNNSSNNATGAGAATGSRRRVWRRRCKSTSNLTSLATTSGGKSSDKKSQNSEDSSSTTDDTGAVILNADRGTSSLQLSDSDDEKLMVIPPRLVHSHSTRRKKGSEMPATFQMETTASASTTSVTKLANVESDSVNENFSPVRPNTKRKRMFKRMALDPDNTNVINVIMDGSCASKSKTGTIKRKKVRSRSACEAPNPASTVKPRNATKMTGHGGTTGTRQRQLSANVVPGKRKRSSREKSLEPEQMIHTPAAIPSHSIISEEVIYQQLRVRFCLNYQLFRVRFCLPNHLDVVHAFLCDPNTF